MSLITGLAHINLTIPPGTLPLAEEFYGTTLGITSSPVPASQVGQLAWFDVIPGAQQIHISFEKGGPNGKPQENGAAKESFQSSRHPCFKVGSVENLEALKERIWRHRERGGEGAPLQADEPGKVASGSKGPEYPTRFFARDYAGNLLEFSL